MDVNFSEPGNKTSANVFTMVQLFGDFRVTVDVFFRVNGPPPDGGTGSTEYYRLGINHTANYLVNLTQDGSQDSPSATDGYYFSATGDAGTTYDYYFYEGNPSAKDDTCGAWADGSTACGVNGNYGDPGLLFKSIYLPYDSNYPGACGDKWTTAKMEYQDGVVSVYLDDHLVHTYDDADDTWSSGKVCLGMEDMFESVAPFGTSFALFDNLQLEKVVGARYKD